MGHFITFEGVEGCGKTTQIRLLGERLCAAGLEVVMTREPGGCRIADKIRALLLDADNSGMSSLTELLLYAAARAQHMRDVVCPALAAGKVVLCDRFTDATVAYQGFGRGIDLATIQHLNQLACQSVEPDLTVLIDCSPETGLRRARRRIEATRGPREERFELEDISFHQRVRNGYLQLATDNPERFITFDGGGSIKDIAAGIATSVLQRMKV